MKNAMFAALPFLLLGALGASAQQVRPSDEATSVNRQNETRFVSLSKLMAMKVLVWDQQNSQWYLDTSALREKNIKQQKTIFDNSEVFDEFSGNKGTKGTGGNW